MSNIIFSIHKNKLEHDQYKEIGMVYHHSHLSKGVNKEHGPDANMQSRKIQRHSETADTVIVLAYQQVTPYQQKLCGFLYSEYKDDDHLHIHDLCTNTPKGAGIGAAMTTLLFEQAKEENIKKISLEATTASYKFYENLLFEGDICPDTNKIIMENTEIEETYEYLNMIYAIPKI